MRLFTVTFRDGTKTTVHAYDITGVAHMSGRSVYDIVRIEEAGYENQFH